MSECMVVTLYSLYECMCKPTFTAIALSVTNRILHDITAHGAWRLLVAGRSGYKSAVQTCVPHRPRITSQPSAVK